jgi:hypothetical protein
MKAKDSNIVESAAAYERWLERALDGDLVRRDLDEKHEKMAADPFQFLRATYWRWAETILQVCPELKDAPSVLAVGDIHIENFGSWRDREGRLVWGVNDFDEAAKMPYALDLVRLATSAVLAKVPGISVGRICGQILRGYRLGLDDPMPFVLDRHHEWLRGKVVVPEDERTKFWDKFDPRKFDKENKKAKKRKITRRYVKALEAARPDKDIEFAHRPRSAGTGSLGRPRWFGYGEWQGAPVVREAKAIVQSGWTLAHNGSNRLRLMEIATGRYRSPDPWYDLRGSILVRRLSPNDRKIELPSKKERARLKEFGKLPQFVNRKMLTAMGRDLAAIHLGTPNRRKDIMADLDQRKRNWSVAAVAAAAEFVRAEQKEWAKEWKKRK